MSNTLNLPETLSYLTARTVTQSDVDILSQAVSPRVRLFLDTAELVAQGKSVSEAISATYGHDDASFGDLRFEVVATLQDGGRFAELVSSLSDGVSPSDVFEAYTVRDFCTLAGVSKPSVYASLVIGSPDETSIRPAFQRLEHTASILRVHGIGIGKGVVLYNDMCRLVGEGRVLGVFPSLQGVVSELGHRELGGKPSNPTVGFTDATSPSVVSDILNTYSDVDVSVEDVQWLMSLQSRPVMDLFSLVSEYGHLTALELISQGVSLQTVGLRWNEGFRVLNLLLEVKDLPWASTEPRSFDEIIKTFEDTPVEVLSLLNLVLPRVVNSVNRQLSNLDMNRTVGAFLSYCRDNPHLSGLNNVGPRSLGGLQSFFDDILGVHSFVVS